MQFYTYRMCTQHLQTKIESFSSGMTFAAVVWCYCYCHIIIFIITITIITITIIIIIIIIIIINIIIIIIIFFFELWSTLHLAICSCSPDIIHTCRWGT